ncbi:MAG: SIR2 family protein [Eubacteriales bacterium]
MSGITFDPSEYIRGLQQILVSDKKKIGFLCGAGTSLAKKNRNSITVPSISVMTEDICKKLEEKSDNKIVLTEIKKEIEDQGEIFNIESLLSNIEQKIRVIGCGTLNKIKKRQFEELYKEIKNEIKLKVNVHQKILEGDNIANLIHLDFAEWIGRTARVHPIEIFTTNYDYLFELGLEHNNVPFYDGFTGCYQPFFYPESIDNMKFLPEQTKLWKIHGSLGWHLNKKTKKVVRQDSDDLDILIYPSSLKYDSSKKQPYTALMDRLTSFLKEPDTVLITIGYSFGDEHINDRIMSALSSNTSTHVLALYYDSFLEKNIKRYSLNFDSDLAILAKSNGKLSVFGCRTAIIGGKLGKWKLKRKPDKNDFLNIDTYFDSDAPIDIEVSIDTEKIGEEQWSGEGELVLPKFEKFVGFLQAMIVNNDLFEFSK